MPSFICLRAVAPGAICQRISHLPAPFTLTLKTSFQTASKENVVLNNIRNVEVRRSDIFSAIKKHERFDTIYWNTPFMYMPSGYKYRSVLERRLFDPGYKITERFLRDGKKLLAIKGRILFGTGDFGDVPRLKKIAKKYR